GAAARLAIARDDLATAQTILAATARNEDPESMRQLAAFLAVRGTAQEMAKDLERRGEQLRLAALLHRAAGDLKAARRAAEGAGGKGMLGGILDEMEDYKALAKLELPSLKEPDVRACLLWRAGDEKGFSALFDEMDDAAKSRALVLDGKPREAIELFDKLRNYPLVCSML